MKMSHKASAVALLAGGILAAGTTSASAATIVFQAEDYVSATSFSTIADLGFSPSGGQSITASVSDGSAPPSATAHYNLAFAEAGTYSIYAKIRVQGGANTNDSIYLPTILGDSPGWKEANDLADVNNGTAYTWINLTSPPDTSNNIYSPNATDGPEYTVASAGTYTFVFGGREDGLNIDVWVLSTDANLTPAQLEGVIPEPAALGLLATLPALLLRSRR